MNISALIMMGCTHVLVTFFMIYFFIKVIRTPKRVEPDSFYENDDE
jgi:hypothetical protein